MFWRTFILVVLGLLNMQLDVSTEQAAGAPEPAVSGKPASGGELQPGSHESVLLKRKRAERRRVQERQLAGENVRVEHSAQKPKGLGLAPDGDASTLPGGRPSPFGPKDEDASGQPASNAAAKPADAAADKPAASGAAAPAEAPATLPGGRVSPFGPKGEETSAQPAAKAATQPAAKAAGDGSTSSATPSGAASGDKKASPSAGQENSSSAPTAPPDSLPGGRPSPFGPRN